MKDSNSLHQKMQEMISCFSSTDPMKEMSEIAAGTEDSALKWLALSTLHGIDRNAESITLTRSADGRIRVTAEYREAVLPSPGPEVAGQVFDTLRSMTHAEGKKMKMPLALGIGNDSFQLEVKIKEKKGGEKVTLKFPNIGHS